MAKLAGWGGTLTIDSTNYLVKSWSLDIEMEEIETSYMGSQWRTYLAGGLVGWKGSLEADFDTTVSDTVTVGDGTVPKPMTSSVALVLELDPTPTRSLSGTAIIQKWSIKKEVAGASSFTCDFTGTGALTTDAT